ncbi:MAG: response regulator transcription factor [Pyrinomonadaceae bacterium]|nr:response regulator transcription factor [Pyrinomonadaceae bacterium]
MTIDIKLLIADDHPVFLKGLSQIIREDSRFKIVAEAHDGLTAFQKIKEFSPDIVILDVSMPKMNGFELARKIQTETTKPELIFLTAYKDGEMFNEAFDLGAKGYVLKSSALDDIISCIETVAAGDYCISPVLTKLLVKRRTNAETLDKDKPGIKGLTPAELKIVKLIAESKSSKEIAGELFVSYRTIENHRSNICAKLDLHGSNSLMKFALENKSKLL